MKTEVIIIRHGETEENRLNIFRGRLDVKLNGNGLRQAVEIAGALKGKDIVNIYSSPLIRAMDTATAIAKGLELEVNVAEAFNNINLGKWQGLPKEEVRKNYPELWEKWIYDTENLVIPGGESIGMVRDRAFRALRALIRDNSGKTFAVVSHRCVIKVLLTAILDIKEKYFWKIYADNASYSIVEHREDRGFTLTLLNEACHLSQKVYEEF